MCAVLWTCAVTLHASWNACKLRWRTQISLYKSLLYNILTCRNKTTKFNIKENWVFIFPFGRKLKWHEVFSFCTEDLVFIVCDSPLKVIWAIYVWLSYYTSMSYLQIMIHEHLEYRDEALLLHFILSKMELLPLYFNIAETGCVLPSTGYYYHCCARVVIGELGFTWVNLTVTSDDIITSSEMVNCY